MYINWLTRDANIDFLKALTHDDCIPLFDNTNLQAIIDFMWNISYWYFVKMQFLPFMIFLYLPVHFIALSNNDRFSFTEWICFASILTGVAIKIFNKRNEFSSIEFKEYLSKTSNQLDFITYLLIIVFVYSVVRMTFFPDSGTTVKEIRVVGIFQIIVMNVQLLYIIRIFQFFARFVRSLLEIVKDAAQIGCMMLFIVFGMSFLFYILDMNSKTPAYTADKTSLWALLNGWAMASIQAYRLALGDFEIEKDFQPEDYPEG